MIAVFSPEYIKNYKKTLVLAYPVVLGQLGHIMVGVVDTAMVGRIGTVEQAAVALANSFYMLVLVFGLGVSYGVTPLVAAADSSGNHKQNASLLKHSVVINTLVGISLFLLLLLLTPLLRMLDQKQEVLSVALPFLNVMIFGMIPLSIFSGLKQFAEGLSFTRVAMFISLGANVLNILLNYLMIFGHWGFPEMGVMGSCWASFISRVVMALVMFAYVYYHTQFKIYWQEYRNTKLSLRVTKDILAIGVPSGLQWLFEIGAFSFAVIMIGWISPVAQAAHQVALSIPAVTYMMASGISAAASVRVGNYLGVNNREGVRIAGYSAFVIVLLFMSVSAVCMIALKNVLPTLFSEDMDVTAIASSLLIVAAFFQLSDGTQVVGLGALRGVKDVKIPTIITLVAYWIIGLPMSYVLGFMLDMGVMGVWYGLSLGLTVAAGLLFWRFSYVSKRI